MGAKLLSVIGYVGSSFSLMSVYVVFFLRFWVFAFLLELSLCSFYSVVNGSLGLF